MSIPHEMLHASFILFFAAIDKSPALSPPSLCSAGISLSST